jgi:SpoVK/Ycf46/Vps4 family AAA+-type ATPase
VDNTSKARLAKLAQRVEPRTNLKDAALAQIQPSLHSIALDAGKPGITVLFAGLGSAAKMPAAEALAEEMHLPLYRVDLSQLVSKYIGETEKNLDRVFDAAGSNGSILLFDEADALFGKHSQVKDSHDRYLNIEVNYLLQKMEAHRGLVILSTKDQEEIDKSLLDYFCHVVKFP